MHSTGAVHLSCARRHPQDPISDRVVAVLVAGQRHRARGRSSGRRAAGRRRRLSCRYLAWVCRLDEGNPMDWSRPQSGLAKSAPGHVRRLGLLRLRASSAAEGRILGCRGVLPRARASAEAPNPDRGNGPGVETRRHRPDHRPHTSETARPGSRAEIRQRIPNGDQTEGSPRSHVLAKKTGWPGSPSRARTGDGERDLPPSDGWIAPGKLASLDPGESVVGWIVSLARRGVLHSAQKDWRSLTGAEARATDDAARSHDRALSN